MSGQICKIISLTLKIAFQESEAVSKVISKANQGSTARHPVTGTLGQIEMSIFCKMSWLKIRQAGIDRLQRSATKSPTFAPRTYYVLK
jgi:hypothetical protein